MKALVIDDHELVRDAICSVLRQLRPDAQIIEGSHGDEVERLILANPDLQFVILDLNLPGRDGMGLITAIRHALPTAPVVVLSAHDTHENVVRSLESGAAGFIPKNATRQVIVSALSLVLAGGLYIPSQALPALRRGGSAAESPASPSPSELGLTDRQIEVMALILEGKSNKAICRVLDLAEPTVKNHVTAILKALRVTSRAEAIVAANALGWRRIAAQK
jgi:DNA-binding NarL/FixJ family response regulator